MNLDIKNLKVGASLPSLSVGPVTRHMIAQYAAGSGDLNPIHVDIDFAQDQAGLPDVIVHGMYSMGCLGRLLSNWAGPRSIRSIDARFENMVPVKESLLCDGEITTIENHADGIEFQVNLQVRKSDDSTVISGSATLFLQHSNQATTS